MFKFGFSGDDDDTKACVSQEHHKLHWFHAVEIKVTGEQLLRKFTNNDYTTITHFDELNINYKKIRSDNVVLKLKKNKHENIINAETQHSDLLPAIYEGGLKVWECSYDLGKYFFSQDISFENLKILDLGCGTGILGILGLLKGSIVHFQDYNSEVIHLATIPNVLLNLQNQLCTYENAEFYAGDWETFTQLLDEKYPNECDKYDVILTSETIYSSENHEKLYRVFKHRLKNNGAGYVAGKSYYFGVGGNMRQFENLVKDDNVFNVENVWNNDGGVQREILKLTYRL